MQAGVLPRAAAAAYCSLSVTTFERRVREGVLPKPRQLSARRVAWLTPELDAALANLPVSDLPPGPARSKR